MVLFWTRAIPHLKLQYSIIKKKVRRHVHTRGIPGNVRLVCFRLPLTVSHNSSMTRATRRTTRHSTSQLLGSDAAASVPPDAETDIVDSHEDLCPSCSVSLARDAKDEHSESWVRCDFCKTWYHWRCVGENGQLDTIDKWFVPLLSYFLCVPSSFSFRFCGPCRAADCRRVITLKPPMRKSARNRPVRDYVNLHSGADSSDPRRWSQLLESKTFTADEFRRMRGSDLTKEWLENDSTPMTEPIVIEQPDGLGMTMPSATLTVPEIANILGHETPVEVIGMGSQFIGSFRLDASVWWCSDVGTQSSLAGWTLGKWASYYSTEQSLREKIRNVISLEISGTKLGEQVMPPRLVRDIDWVEKFWPDNRKGNSHPYPKVQLYCLMGVAGAWTVRCPDSMIMALLPDGLALGLAHRFRWFICLLPYSQRIEGLSFFTPHFS